MPFVNGIWMDEEVETDSSEETPTEPDIPEVEIPIPEYPPLTNSVMLTVKKMLGIAEEYHAFDLDVITNINAVFLTLNQLGVGPRYPFLITGPETQWEDFLGLEQNQILQGIQTYMYMRVRMMFDPPTNSFLVDSLRKQIEEMEWRFMTQVDYHTYRDGKLNGELMVEMSDARVEEIYNKAKAGDKEAIAMLSSFKISIPRHRGSKQETIKDIFR